MIDVATGQVKIDSKDNRDRNDAEERVDDEHCHHASESSNDRHKSRSEDAGNGAVLFVLLIVDLLLQGRRRFLYRHAVYRGPNKNRYDDRTDSRSERGFSGAEPVQACSANLLN